MALLEDMIILQEYQGQKLGSSLLTFALNLAKIEGCKRITLLTDDDNIKAHTFYKKHGFKASTMKSFRLHFCT